MLAWQGSRGEYFTLRLYVHEYMTFRMNTCGVVVVASAFVVQVLRSLSGSDIF